MVKKVFDPMPAGRLAAGNGPASCGPAVEFVYFLINWRATQLIINSCERKSRDKIQENNSRKLIPIKKFN